MPNVLPFLKALAETIREAPDGQMPSGHLYGLLMPLGVSLNEYEALVAILVRGKLIECTRANLLKWIGPADSAGVSDLPLSGGKPMNMSAPAIAGRIGA